MRANEVYRLCGDRSLLKEKTAVPASYRMHDTLDWMLFI